MYFLHLMYFVQLIEWNQKLIYFHSVCLLMREFKAIDFPFGKASGPSPQTLLHYIIIILIFSLTQELFRIAFLKIPRCSKAFVITFNSYVIVSKEYGMLYVCVCAFSIDNKKEYIYV